MGFTRTALVDRILRNEREPIREQLDSLRRDLATQTSYVEKLEGEIDLLRERLEAQIHSDKTRPHRRRRKSRVVRQWLRLRHLS